MTTMTHAGRTPALHVPGKNLPVSGRELIGSVLRWRERARQRRALAGLTPEQLADVGIDAHAARIEAAKPFWQA